MKNILLPIITALALTACNNKQNPYAVNEQNIGLLTDSTQVKDLKLAFPNDSIVKPIGGDEFIGIFNPITIYEKGGNPLLTLTPNQSLDSTATINHINILDSKYKTAQGITSLSTFKDLKEKLKIRKIDNTLRSVIIYIENSNIFFNIDKNELPAEIRYNMSQPIEAVQIPDTAKIKAFMVSW